MTKGCARGGGKEENERERRVLSFLFPISHCAPIDRASVVSIRRLRTCLHGGGGPKVGEVTRLGGVNK